MPVLPDSKGITALPSELFSIIVGYLPEGDRTKLLVLNQMLFTRIMPIVWNTVNGLHRLLLLLPFVESDTLEGLGPDDDSDVSFLGVGGTTYVRFQVERLPEREDRIRLYSPHVKVLNICDPKHTKYVFLNLAQITHLRPLAPHLSKIVFYMERTLLDPPIDQTIAEVLSLFDHIGIRSVTIATAAGTDSLEVSRHQLVEILRILRESRASIETLSLQLDFRLVEAAAHETTRSFLFQGFSGLTELSCQAPLIKPCLAPIRDLGLIPNLTHLELRDWTHVAGLTRVHVPEDGNTRFLRLREVVFAGIYPGQAAHLLSSVFPDRLRSIEVSFSCSKLLDSEMQDVFASFIRHRAQLSSLKLALTDATTAKVLPDECLQHLAELSELETLEVKHHMIPGVFDRLTTLSWPRLQKLRLPDHRFSSEDVKGLAKTRPLLEELAMTLGPWTHPDVIPPGGLVRGSNFTLSPRPMSLISSFRIGNFEDSRVEGIARFLVSNWVGIVIKMEDSLDCIEGVNARGRKRDHGKYLYLSQQVVQARNQLLGTRSGPFRDQ